MPAALTHLLEARSVAVVGVSDDPTKLGRVVLRNLQHAGFDGRIYGLGRVAGDIDGVRCFAAPKDLPEPVDAAFLAIPAEATAGSLRALAAAGVKVAICGAAGFAEDADAEGIARQAELKRIVAETGIRLVGPNCNGIYNVRRRLSIGFNTAHGRRLEAGDIAILSHSGALFEAMASRLHTLGAGISLFVSAGNEADLDLLDYLEFVVADAGTRVVALLLDALGDGDRFRRLADQARRAGKHLVALKIGLSEIGARAAVAHSSRIAGSAAAYAALFDAAGVPMVHSLEGLMAAAALLSRYGKASGMLAAMSSSGAGAALLADLAARHDVPMAPLRPETRAELHRITRFSQAGNPTDLGIFQGMPRREEVPSIVAADPDVGVVLALSHSFALDRHPALGALVRARREVGKPCLLVAPGGLPAEERQRYEAGGVPVLADTESTLQGIAAMLLPPRDYPAVPARPAIADDGALNRKRPLTEPESLAFLARFGVATVATRVCRSADEAVMAATEFGFPVVLKAVVPGVAHKSDHGLVRLGLAKADAVRAAYEAMGAPAEVAVQPQIAGALEAIVGVARSPGVGLVLLAGLGGLHAEAFGAPMLWPLPTSRAEIERKLGLGPLGRVFASARWQHTDARAALVAALLALQDAVLWAGDRLAAIDINPLILGGGRAIAVDALVVPAETKEA